MQIVPLLVIPRDIPVMNFRPKEEILFWGDVMHVQRLQLPDPKVTVVFDVDPTAAAVTRDQLLRKLASEDVLTRATHDLSWARSPAQGGECLSLGASGIYRSMGREIVMLRGKPTGQFCPFCTVAKSLSAPPLQQFPWRPMANVFVDSRLCIPNHRARERRTYGPLKIERGTLKPRFEDI